MDAQRNRDTENRYSKDGFSDTANDPHSRRPKFPRSNSLHDSCTTHGCSGSRRLFNDQTTVVDKNICPDWLHLPGVQASGDATVISVENKVILGGLIFQIIALCFFLFMTWRIAARFGQIQETHSGSTCYPEPGWRKHFWALYAVSVLLIIRNLVRAIEYAQQMSGRG